MTAPADDSFCEDGCVLMGRHEVCVVSDGAATTWREAENELIAQRLLGWKPFSHPETWKRWIDANGATFDDPTFTTWHEAGLILEALFAQSGVAAIRVRGELANLLTLIKLPSGKCQFTPLAIRTVALSYLRSLER